MKKTILITVPHSACPTDPFRNCDIMAAPTAYALKDLLKDSFHIIGPLETKIPRSKVDANREEILKTEYGETLIAEIAKADYVIDCHSFPNNPVRERTFGLFCYILDFSPSQTINNMIVSEIERSTLMPAATENIIISLAKRSQKYHTLLEMNEDLKSKKQTFNLVCASIAQSIKQFFSEEEDQEEEERLVKQRLSLDRFRPEFIREGDHQDVDMIETILSFDSKAMFTFLS